MGFQNEFNILEKTFTTSFQLTKVIQELYTIYAIAGMMCRAGAKSAKNQKYQGINFCIFKR